MKRKALKARRKISIPKSPRSKKKGLLIWAVDTTQDPKESKQLIAEMRTWSKRMDCDILPVTVFADPLLNLPQTLAANLTGSFIDFANQSQARFLKKAKADTLPGEVIILPNFSKRQMVQALIQFAEQKNAQMIFANTRAREAWNIFRLGSFAETLVSTSTIPVLLMNPDATSTDKIPSVLFPTDFSLASYKAVTQFKPWAQQFGAKIVLYNQIESPNMYLVTDPMGTWPTAQANLEAVTEYTQAERTKKAQSWVKALKQDDIDVTPVIKRQKKYLGTEIVELARDEKVSLIVMAHMTGATAQTILGSIARDVILRAHCPVLTFYRPKAKNLSLPTQRPRLTTAYAASPSKTSPTPLP